MVIERFDHLFVHKGIQVGKIRNHPGGRVDRAREEHFDGVVVAVAIRVVALAVDPAVFFFSQLHAMQAVRRREMIAAAEFNVQSIRNHAAPFAPLR